MLTAENRASHLDGALKEWMRQIRNLKEEHDVIQNKAKQFDIMKHEFEAKIANLDQIFHLIACRSSIKRKQRY